MSDNISPVSTPESSSPLADIVGAAASTIAAPTNPVVIFEDLMLAHKIVGDIRSQLVGKHPRLWDIITFLFHIQTNN